MKKVLVIIPTYNEAKNIGQVVNSIEAEGSNLKAYRFNILVADDNSKDHAFRTFRFVVEQLMP